ncbi:hypothetical protein [Foetidibacter luteolus]|uniref:hypothetical protein n=1 Tax=Foetidibacter luteolus TaxID=2608880 RepID=UPI00129B5FFE|nr:hypothetical protein [Foetidibacter luteolus]
MKKYVYTAVNPCHTIVKINGEEVHVSFVKDEVYLLPSNEPEILKLIESGLLEILKSKNKYSNGD